MISVILTCHQRFNKFEGIILGWLEQRLVTEVIIVDNSGTFKTRLPDTTVFSISKNLGPQAKYPFSFMAKNRWVLFADDDIMPIYGIGSDLWRHRHLGVVGVIGRVFDGKSYYTSTGVRGENIKEPKKVDGLGGGCTLAPRELGNVNVMDCPGMEVDDWWWETNFEKDLFVIPTDKYIFLKEGKEGLHKTKKCKEMREEFYETQQHR